MASVPFQPTQIPNCIVWFDAADGTTITSNVGAQVTRINNKGTLTTIFGSNVAVSPYTAGTNPPGTVTTGNTFSGGTSNVLSFPPSSGFNGSYLGVSGVVTTQKSRTFIYIFSISNPGLDNYFRVFTSADKTTLNKQTGFAAWNRDGNGIINWPTGSEGTEALVLGGQGDFAGLLTNSVPFIVAFRHSTTLANNYVSVNGTQITSPATNQALVNGYFTGTDNFALGVGTGYSATLLLGELMQYDGEISTPQIRQIEGYLAWKWGRVAQLPATHPYKNGPPTGTTLFNTTQVNFVNTYGTFGTLQLPSTFTIPGRVITFKDQNGAFSTNTMTLTTNNANQTIDSLITSTINNTRLGWQNFIAGNNNKWYTVGGTLINTVNTSTMNAQTMSSVSISTGNVFVSTMGFVDQTFGSTNTLSVQSSLMYYNYGGVSTILAGTRQSFGGAFLRMGGVFSPQQISGLNLWMDAADQNTVSLQNNSVTQWRDKSSNQYVFNGSPATLPTYVSRLNGLPVLSSATGQKLTLTNWNQNFTFATMFFLIWPTQNVLVDYQGYPIFRQVTGLGTIQLDITYANVFPYYYYLQIWTNNSFILQASLNISGTFNPTNLPLLMTGVVNGIANGNIGRYNGSTLATTPGNNPNTFVNLTGVTIDLIGANDARNFDTAEILLYGRVLTASEYEQVEGYLAWKWGLVANLPPTHLYKNAPP